MILYHGSNVTVSEPRLVEQNRYLDFGLINSSVYILRENILNYWVHLSK